MNLRRLIPLACLATFRLPAATIIDVTGCDTIRLYTGDALRFTIPASNFNLDAAMLGLRVDLTLLSFQFVSVPPDSPGQFLAGLESGDGGISLTSATPLSFVPGWFIGSGYDGPMSALSGTFSFSLEESRRLFAGSGAVLTLRNTGPAIVVGLPPYSLRQDLNATLAGCRLNVGALPVSVGYVDPPPGAAVPEPSSAAMLACGGAVFWVLSATLRRRLARVVTRVCGSASNKV